MRQEGPDVDVTFFPFPLAVFLAFVMNGRDQSISVPTNIEYHVVTHCRRIREGLLTSAKLCHRAVFATLYQASISLAASRYFSLASVRCFRVARFMGSRSAALEYFAFCKASSFIPLRHCTAHMSRYEGPSHRVYMTFFSRDGWQVQFWFVEMGDGNRSALPEGRLSPHGILWVPSKQAGGAYLAVWAVLRRLGTMNAAACLWSLLPTLVLATVLHLEILQFVELAPELRAVRAT